MKISVVIAAYNGEKFIEQQLDSILKQLKQEDEIIVSDDNPNSVMSNLVKDISKRDNRVKYVEGKGQGLIKNFQNAIEHSTGDVIFLSDQDDVWLDNKVRLVMQEFESGADLVLHNATVADENLKPTSQTSFEQHDSKSGYLKNIIKNSFMGCCMAFKSEMKDLILPFPDDIPMHDQWIGLVALQNKKNVVLIDTPLIYYRRHGGNVTSRKVSVSQKIEWRKNLIKNLKRK